MKRREFISLGGAPQQPKAARELSRAAFGMNCRRGPVPFITCGSNRQRVCRVPRSLLPTRENTRPWRANYQYSQARLQI
jgi:hypothetical protein